MAKNVPANFCDDLSPAFMAGATRPVRAWVRSTERGRRARIDMARRGFVVASDSGRGNYLVRVADARQGHAVCFTCTCPDGEYRPGEGGCHHVGSVARRLARAGLVTYSDSLKGWVPTDLAVTLGSAQPAYTEAELEDAFAGLPS